MEKFYVVLFVCYMAFAYNRKSVSLSMPKLIEEEGLDTSYAGLILSCQNVAMSFSKFLFGILADRMNPLKLFASGLLLTGTTTLLFSSSSTVVAFCTFWFLNGCAHGCGWPPLSKIIRQRTDPQNFGTIWSFLSASNNVSGCLSPFLTTYLAVNYGWRYGLYSAGMTSVLLCVAPVFLMYSAPPVETKSSDNSEAKVKNSDSSQTIGTLLKDPFLWLVFTCFLVVFCARSTIVDWGLLFMKQERDIPLTRGSAFTSSFECGGFIGRLLAGYVSDIFVQRSQKNKGHQVPSYQIRMYVAIGFLLGAIAGIHMFRTFLNAETSLVWIMITGFTCGAFLYGLIAIFGIAASESAPSHLSGTAYAIAALGGNLGATLSGLPICYLASRFSWSTVLLLLQTIIFVMLTLVICLRNLQSSVSSTKKND